MLQAPIVSNLVGVLLFVDLFLKLQVDVCDVYNKICVSRVSWHSCGKS